MVTRIVSFLLIVYLSTISCAALASAKTTVDRTQLGQNETLELVIEVDEPTTGQPDFSLFPKALQVIRSSAFHHSSIINGVASINSGWRVTIKVTEAGIVTIPSLDINGEKTAPIQLRVKPASDKFNAQPIGSNEPSTIFITVETDKQEVVPQEQIIATIKIYSAVTTQYKQLTEPQLEDVIMEQLDADISYDKYVNGQRYNVIERKYAIFPQKPQLLTIPPITFSAEIVQGRPSRSIFGNLTTRTRPVSVTSNPVTVNVTEQPNVSVAWWLPAHNVSLEAKWQPDSPEFTVGEPVTLQLSLIAKGVSKTQLPEFELGQTSNMKWYSDNSETTQEFDSQYGFVSRRVERYAVVPTQAGTISIPEISIPWWNTATKKMEYATIPPQEFKVNPAAKATAQPLIQSSANQPQEVKTVTEYDPGYWPWLSAFLGFAWLSTLILLLRGSSGSIREFESKVEKEKPRPLKINRLVTACHSNDPIRIKEEVLEWCGFNLPHLHIHSLGQLAQIVESDEFSRALLDIEARIYGSTPNDSEITIENYLTELQKLAQHKPVESEEEQLPPLFKIS